MKHFITSLLLALICQTALGQSATTIFNDFGDKRNAEMTTVPKLATTLAGSLVGDKDISKLMKQENSIRVLNLDDCSKSVCKKFAKKINALAKNDYEQLYGINKKRASSTILVRQDGDIVKEIVMLVYDKDDCMGVLVKGQISTSDLSDVIDLVGVPSASED